MRRVMKPWEVIATLLKANQMRIVSADPIRSSSIYPAIFCARTGEEITLENVQRIQIEHWPIREKHGGPVSPDNAVISLSEGHAIQTRREQKADAKERRLAIARRAKRDVEVRLTKSKWRLKKKVGTGEVVKVRTR